MVRYIGQLQHPQDPASAFNRDLGLDLNYASGTVVSFCGTILEHQVSSWGVGDRICYAHFMRELVRKRLDVSPAGWVKQEIYLSNQF